MFSKFIKPHPDQETKQETLMSTKCDKIFLTKLPTKIKSYKNRYLTDNNNVEKTCISYKLFYGLAAALGITDLKVVFKSEMGQT